jgi:solute carrier family 25 phosphate transporter 23/24/25/41
MAPGESKDERDERVARLWGTLDTRKEGHIDLNGLKKGLKKIDHRELLTRFDAESFRLTRSIALKNADGMLRSILREVDTNGDGRIDYDGMIDLFTSVGCDGAYAPSI